MRLVSELKRRNVIRMAVLYLVAAWLIMQIAEVVIGLAALPAWIGQATLVVLALAFPIVLIFSWLFELTPEGLVLEKEVPEGHSLTHITGRRIDFVVIALLSAAVAMFAFDKWWSPADDLSIAVLPFENLSDDPQYAYFAHGIHDELLTRLSSIRALKVISRTSVMPYRATTKILPQIADELSVANVVEGSVRRSGNLVHLNVQLIDARTDEHLWAGTFSRELTAEELVEVQSEIAKSIASALQAKLTPSENRALESRPTESLAAYDAYLAGLAERDTWSDPEDDREAIEWFTKATEIDPDFALAYAGLCESHLALYRQTSNQQHFGAGETACNKSIELDDSRPEVHIAAALLYSARGRYAQAEVSLRQADFAKSAEFIASTANLDRITTQAKLDLASVYGEQGRIADARLELKRALESDPRNWKVHDSLFSFYYNYSDLPNRFELAVSHAATAAALNPNIALTWNNLGAASFMMGSYEDAADAWAHAAEIKPNRTTLSNTGLAYYYSGKFAKSAEMQRKAIKLAPTDHRAWGRLGDALSYIEGKGDESVEVYEKAVELAQDQLKINDREWKTWGMLATYLASTNHPEDAVVSAERSMELSRRNSESLFYAAVVEIESGREEQCLDLLEEAVSQDPSYRDFIAIEPDFAALSSNPRYQSLLTDPLQPDASQ